MGLRQSLPTAASRFSRSFRVELRLPLDRRNIMGTRRRAPLPPMPLTHAQRQELERLTVGHVRLLLAYAGAGPEAVVPGLGDGTMLRSDVAQWVNEKDRDSRQAQRQLRAITLDWAKVGTWTGAAGIIVAIIIAAIGR
jgi:hypothetical protein